MPDKVGILGLSLGSILTLLLAAESSVIKPRCCVCISGHHIYPPPQRGTLKGFYEVFTKKSHKIHVDENNNEIWRDIFLPVPEHLSEKVDVKKINCPMLLVNGQDDQNLPTVEAAEDIDQMMRAAGKEHLLTRLEYPGAGHLIEPPYSPHFRATTFKVDDTTDKLILLWGGQTKPHSDAQEDSWKKILAFLKQHLYSSPALGARM